jgi:hypothetical protein
MVATTKTTPLDDALEAARGVETSADGRKLKYAPQVGAHVPDADADVRPRRVARARTRRPT